MSKEIVEVRGVKFEVDLESARKISEFRVGDCVKVLIKDYGDKWESHAGVVLGFDAFKNLPTVNVVYLDMSYDSATLKFISFNENASGVEIAPLTGTHELQLSKSRVTDFLQMAIEKKTLELEEAKLKKDTFLRMFGAYFERETGEAELQ